MSAGLDASTVTPGRTAPEASLTVPTIDADACAKAMPGIAASDTRITIALTHRSMMVCLLEFENRCSVTVNESSVTIRAFGRDARPKMAVFSSHLTGYPNRWRKCRLLPVWAPGFVRKRPARSDRDGGHTRIESKTIHGG